MIDIAKLLEKFAVNMKAASLFVRIIQGEGIKILHYEYSQFAGGTVVSLGRLRS